MIVVFTDFGLQGPYTGQMKAVLHQLAPAVPAIDHSLMRQSAIPRHPPTCWQPLPNGLRREPCFCAWSIPVSAGRGRPLFSKPMVAGTSAPATVCSSGSAPSRNHALLGHRLEA